MQSTKSLESHFKRIFRLRVKSLSCVSKIIRPNCEVGLYNCFGQAFPFYFLNEEDRGQIVYDLTKWRIGMPNLSKWSFGRKSSNDLCVLFIDSYIAWPWTKGYMAHIVWMRNSLVTRKWQLYIHEVTTLFNVHARIHSPLRQNLHSCCSIHSSLWMHSSLLQITDINIVYSKHENMYMGLDRRQLWLKSARNMGQFHSTA